MEKAERENSLKIMLPRPEMLENSEKTDFFLEICKISLFFGHIQVAFFCQQTLIIKSTLLIGQTFHIFWTLLGG